ncbi:MAG: hypothetical protein KDB35_07315 [Acidimicrobiales bacterium]|nr:hypothetical protein [Acidimicrobiales bacterium]
MEPTEEDEPPMSYVPVQIVGVIAEEVGSPRNDGSRGSGLYSVPVALSRSLSSDEASLMKALWDSPPSFTTMHRPGIARVVGDRITLDGTTVEEVERYHATTLARIVEKFNVDAAALVERRGREQSEAGEAEAEHRRRVDEVSSRIKFEP